MTEKRCWKVLKFTVRECFFSVQHECIPQAILSMDVLCQAKSGMGKTAVFVLATLQQLEPVDGQVKCRFFTLLSTLEAELVFNCFIQSRSSVNRPLVKSDLECVQGK